MGERKDAPTIVIERDSGGGLGSFVLGALVGAGIALLFAPKTGEETQKELKARALKLRSATEDRLREAQTRLEERLGEAREGVHARVETVKDAVDAGRVAAREARDELERKLVKSKAAYRAGVEAAREAGDEDEDEEEAGEED